ncbi:uncharacterized protein LOC129728613 [Wyeomyia smithii]|uniref:uncharacterized protein LOC129728613 n=1 Tax=Wyeomyia smithii TaxID=174621 RepID=UPI002467F7E6|nr:uncharacterized protein LOC129728613 [Wyeomyia smithii]
MIDNFVVNLSSTQFTQADLKLLNKGLNFAVPPQCAPLADMVSNIEAAIQYENFTLQSAVRQNVKQCISRTVSNRNSTENNSFEMWYTIRQLRTRNVIYYRADKGNAVVIMDKGDYESRVCDMIKAGPYEEHKFKNGKPRDPLNAMVEEVNFARQKVAHLMGEERLERKFHVPNPMVASLYCLPKIHKNPVGMRPIFSNIRTPTEKMAAWLVEEMKKYPITHGKSVKNSVDLVQQLEGFKIKRGEIMVSFDVTALFPSIPVTDALKSLRQHLERSRVPHHHMEAYLLIAEVCMNQNYFTFRGKCFKQTFGLSMGCKLSPLLANVFMSDFEEAAGKENYCPRVWKRYVDDVFALVKERYLPQTLDLLNSRHNSIKFTVEREVEGKLPFLDLMITRKEDGTLKFGIYRKPTSTDRYITADSNHFGGQKQAAFHAMAHRLFNVPMEAEEFAKEQQQICKAAEINGYDKRFVDKILGKQKRKQEKQQITTLLPGSSEIKRISLPFYPKVTNRIKNTLRRLNFQIVHKSENTLRDLLCNLKDKVPPDEHSGIYRILCQNCPSVYIGQTRRKVKVRIKEHKHAVDNAKSCESSVAAHTVTLDHQIDWKNAKIIKNVRKTSHLNAWESLHISNPTEPLMNEDDPPITSCLFNILKRRIP